MRIGVIGTGNLGAPVAANLVEDGHEVRVFDECAERGAKVALRGAVVAVDMSERALACGYASRWSRLTVQTLPPPTRWASPNRAPST